MTFFNCDIFYYLCKAVWQCPVTVLNTPLRRNKDLIADTFASLLLFLSEGNTCKKKKSHWEDSSYGNNLSQRHQFSSRYVKKLVTSWYQLNFMGRQMWSKEFCSGPSGLNSKTVQTCPQHVAEFGGGRKRGIGDESLQHPGFLRVLWSCEKGEVGKIEMVSNLLRTRQLEHGLSEML